VRWDPASRDEDEDDSGLQGVLRTTMSYRCQTWLLQCRQALRASTRQLPDPTSRQSQVSAGLLVDRREAYPLRQLRQYFL
jgi:hypothetical protein